MVFHNLGCRKITQFDFNYEVHVPPLTPFIHYDPWRYVRNVLPDQ